MSKVLFALAALVAVAYGIAPLYRHKEVEEGSYIVVFNVDAPHLLSNAEVAAYLTTHGIHGEVAAAYFIKTDKIETSFRGFSAKFDQANLERILENKHVKYVEEDAIVRLPAFEESNATLGAEPTSYWGLSRGDQRCLPNKNQFGPCDVAGNTNCQGTNSVIWVVDTGVRYTHQDFTGRATLAADYATGSPSQYNGDCNGHGTHVAGSAAGATYGIARKAQIRSVRVLNCQGSGTNTGVINGFNYVGTNAMTGYRNIMSASLGGGKSTATNEAVESLIAKGVVSVVAAGNDNADACSYSPASAKDVISVGATDSTDTRASFSNYGTCVTVFAPGVSITSAWYTSDTASNTISGTSMATPYVSGAVAILNSAATQTHAQVKASLTGYATQNVVKSPGTGSPNLFLYDRFNDGTSRTC